eukprot:TRINITY_DN3098_c0_g2_i1.p1 TRINITY_DN3098_c0_g2~~TRINITY_DN3098_c0_g2_i1.p1  ORF type:complete len:489 (-),score=122.52 TRINITY_DN3098_c0_g2_i1:12-1478(-)
MGQGMSNDEKVYQAVQKGEINGIIELRRQGASLEWVDSHGRTPLMLACSTAETYGAAEVLLQLGANVNAFRKGPEGGYPIHHAARRGLDRTIALLLHYGADVLAPNETGLSSLDLARMAGFVSTVRFIEDHFCLFAQNMKQLTGPSFLEVFTGMLSKRMWVVVLPGRTDRRLPPRFELVLYASPKVAMPSANVLLDHAELSISKPESSDPVLNINDKINRVQIKLAADKDLGGTALQVHALFNACRGNSQVQRPPRAASVGAASAMWPAQTSVAAPPPDRTAPAPPPAPTAPTPAPTPAPPNAPADVGVGSSARPPPAVPQPPARAASDFGGWAAPTGVFSLGGWGSPVSTASPAPPPNVAPSATSAPSSAATPPAPEGSIPSAPPLPVGADGQIYYPTIDTSPININYGTTAPAPSLPQESALKAPAAAAATGTQCVICWDAPAGAVCVPCGHVAGCIACLSEVKEKGWGCPVCRSNIREVVKVYQV